MEVKNSKKVKGDGDTVTFWNLIRSYILLHHKDEDVIFYAYGMNDNNDFMHYSRVKVIPLGDSWDEAVREIKYNIDSIGEPEEGDEPMDVMMVMYRDGKFLKYEYD